MPIVATEKTIVCADTTSIADYNIPSMSTLDVVLQLLPNYLFHYWSSYFQLAGFALQLLTPAKLTMADANISAQQQAPGVYAAAGLVTSWPTMAPVVLVRQFYNNYCSNMLLSFGLDVLAISPTNHIRLQTYVQCSNKVLFVAPNIISIMSR